MDRGDLLEEEILVTILALLSHLNSLLEAAVAAATRCLHLVRQNNYNTHTDWMVLVSTPQRPRYWVYPHRSMDWWKNCVLAQWEDSRWVRNFRMSRRTFMWLVDILKPHLFHQDTQMRHAWPVDLRVAMSLWYLANKNSFREVQEQFGVGLTTVADAVHEFCMVVEEVLVPRLVKLTDPMEQIMLGFAEIGFPQCVGAVDGCHIPIQNPADSNGEYINRKKFASIVLMAICDHRGRFYAAEAGESGKSHDAYIFNGCHFTHAIDRGAFFPATPSLVVDGVAVPPLGPW
ncbi:putative nuclease HARBI1 [Sphaerodactylus townsendi]|uniref:putative nuclease HARBI1 n=1 Tax=Sphaerodactylus townsendi TaxID=933632 RepID=UPI00202698BE|nr:putative nuclease HARBI1 [Sphaerodactylus townsendi]